MYSIKSKAFKIRFATLSKILSQNFIKRLTNLQIQQFVNIILKKQLLR